MEILNAYRKAAGKVSARELMSVLENIQHAYPYHQAIGFLLEKSGNWNEEEIAVFRNTAMQYDFYLDYEMHEPCFSRTWRLYYPASLDDAQSQAKKKA